MTRWFLNMGQQEIAIIFIVFLFLMIVSPVMVAILGRITRFFRDDAPSRKDDSRHR